MALKMDSIIRKSVDWLDEVGLVISDEIHLIGDDSRGPTLEMVLTQLKRLESKPQILGLSATITNSDELAKWLGCELVQNSWRPVPLSEGVYDGGLVTMDDEETFEVENTIRGPPIDLGIQCVKQGGQSLIFAETRTRSKSLATKAMDGVESLLDKKEIAELAKISKKILSSSENTDLVKTLAILIKKGVEITALTTYSM